MELSKTSRLLSLCLVILLSSCAPKKTSHLPYLNPIQKGAVYGATGGILVGALTSGLWIPASALAGGIVGGLIGYDIDKYTPEDDLAGRMRHQRVQIITVGEEFKLVIPADRLFFGDGPRLKAGALDVLNLTASFLRRYKKEDLKIAVYSDTHSPETRSVALTRERAGALVDYLGTEFTNSRIIVGYGYGSAFPIASNESGAGRSINRRVVISFRKLVIQ